MSEPPDARLEPGDQITDRKTFERVFRRYYAPLLRYAQRIAGDRATAADALQDVFLKLWTDRERLTVEASLQAMLYTMVRNRTLNLLRGRNRVAPDVSVEDALERGRAAGAELASGGDPTGDPTGDASGGDRALATEELQRRLHTWIEALPERRREAFTLSRYHGLSHSEIARIMNISERTVDTHIVYALRDLRRRLDKLDEGTAL